MSRRNEILAEVKRNQPAPEALPDVTGFEHASQAQDLLAQFAPVLASIGGEIFMVKSLHEIEAKFAGSDVRVVSPLLGLPGTGSNDQEKGVPHELHDVGVAVIKGDFAVAENGAVWVTEEATGHRALPFICQHLSLVIDRKDIVATMHHAYDRIGTSNYGFGVFIAGPSRTADIEQSLVLGAHGSRSVTVYVIG